MDPLSVTASVVGLLTAAAKVYTLLEGISAIKQCPATIQEAKTEVKHAEMALCSMQRYLQRLDLVNPQRAALIQIDELRVALADAMLAFSDFESLLQLISGLARIHVAITWVRYVKVIEEHLAKLQRYKTSLTLMLTILHGESDLEASQSQARLHVLIEDVLNENKTLRRLLFQSQDSFDAMSIFTKRTTDNYTLVEQQLSHQNDDDALTIRGTTHVDAVRSSISTMSVFGVNDADFAFESILEQSWVYRRNQRNDCDCSFVSSVQRSHAWSVFSGYSLADISVLSVIAMPLTLRELANAKYYQAQANQDQIAGTSEDQILPFHILDERVGRPLENPNHIANIEEVNPTTPHRVGVQEQKDKEETLDSAIEDADQTQNDSDQEKVAGNTTTVNELDENADVENDFEQDSVADENINWDVVYALMTFIATVEGHVNAAKGETMIVLDDSHNHWWLVRMTKDSSIGYLPAEHIEMPVERLARLNKHRNIDIGSADIAKAKGEPKTALWRPLKNPLSCKTVTFAERPTFIGQSLYDDSDADPAEEDTSGWLVQQELHRNQQLLAENAECSSLVPISQRNAMEETQEELTEGENDGTRETKKAAEISEATTCGNGPMRERTKWSFTDLALETKRISLTPSLLRDDASSLASFEFGNARLEKGSGWLEEKEVEQTAKKPKRIRSLFSMKRRDNSAEMNEYWGRGLNRPRSRG